MKLGLAYVPAHLPDHIKADMSAIKLSGCDEVLFAIQENHLNNITGAVRFGPNLAQKTGLKPYVLLWGYANTFGGGRMSIFMLENQDVWRVHKDGQKIPMGCLNNPKLADSFLKNAKLCQENGFEGVYIDEPTLQDCFCEICQDKFRKTFGGNLRTAEGNKSYRKFQLDSMFSYTANLCKAVKYIDRKLKTFCCIMPFDQECFKPIAGIPELDVLATDPYWLVEEDKTIEWAISIAEIAKKEAVANNKDFQLWLNLWKIPAGREPEVYTGGKKLAEVGCDSFYTWGYKAALGTCEESDNPDRAWRYFQKLSKELSKHKYSTTKTMQ